MKKRSMIAFISISALIVIFATAGISSSKLQDVYVVDHRVYLDGFSLDSLIENGLLSYQNKTYVSLRDVAKIFHKSICWDEENKNICLGTQNPEKIMFRDEETALKLGVAFVEDHFSEQVGAKTEYAVSTGHDSRGRYFYVFAVFDHEEVPMDAGIEEAADVMISFNQTTWEMDLFTWSQEEDAWIGLEGTPSEGKITVREHI